MKLLAVVLIILSRAQPLEPPNPAFYDMNEYRIERGIDEIKINAIICNSAQKRADYLSSNHIFNHDDFKQQHREFMAGLNQTSTAENLAIKYSDDQVVTAWSKSQKHREIMEEKKYKRGCIVRSDEVVVLWLTN